MQDRARRLLSKPIKFFQEMEVLFTGSSADGSLAMDQNTCLDSDSGSDDCRELQDLNSYPAPEEVDHDSDTMPPPSRRSVGDNSSSSNTGRSSMKRSRGSTSSALPSKETNSKNRASDDDITDTIKSLKETLDA